MGRKRNSDVRSNKQDKVLITVKAKKKNTNTKDLASRVDMASMLVDIGFEDVDPDAEEQLLYCVFHNDSATPSFSVNLEKKVFHCFSSACALSGSAVTLFALWKGISYEQAVHEIQYMPKIRSIEKIRIQLARKRSVLSSDRKLQVLTEFITSMPMLSGTEYAEVLERRKISKKTMDWFGLRAYDAQIAGQFDIDLLFHAGIANAWKNIVFRNHPLLFPFWLGKSVAFIQGRLAVDDPQRPKYLGSRGTVPCMFGHSNLWGNPKETYITEGVIDALSLHELGIGPALGIVGTEGFKASWADDFDGTERVFIATDNDPAGRAAFVKLSNILEGHTSVRRHLFPGQYKDINEFLVAQG